MPAQSAVTSGATAANAASDTKSGARVDGAIMRVLQAEQAARAAVVQDAAHAERLRDDARQRARAIAERAALRVARVHQRVDAAITERLEHIRRQRAALTDAPPDDGAESARLERALDRLAAELTEGR